MGRAIRNLLQTALPINFHLKIISVRLMYFCLSKVTSVASCGYYAASPAGSKPLISRTNLATSASSARAIIKNL